MKKKVTKKQQKEKDTPIIKEKKHRARRRSIREGIYASAETSFGFQYLSPFAIAINASNSLVAMMGSVAGLLGPMSQMFSSRLMEKYKRKRIVLHSVFWEALMWLPIIALAILYQLEVFTGLLPLIFILFFAIRVILNNVGGPAWFSWVGDLVDEEYRGRWFAKRNLILGFISILLAIGAAFFLDYFRNQSWTMIGFIVLFGLAFISRMMSWHFMHDQYEPQIKLKKGYYFSFWTFLLNSPKNNFGRFALFRAFLAFSQSIAAPLFAVYLLRTLGFNYATYMAIVIAGSFFSLILINLWGKFADKYGNCRTIAVTSFFIPLIPILYILSQSPIYLALVPGVVGGLAWAGFNLAAGNFIYDNVSQERRGLVVSYYNMLMGIGVFLGAGLGAILIKFINTSTIEPIIIIFIISGLLRMLAVIFGIPHIKEVRKTKAFSGKTALKNLLFRDAKNSLSEEAHQIMSIKKYLTAK